MKSSLTCLKLSIKKSPIHGYGVFADQDIGRGAIIEECHVLQCKNNNDGLRDYFFQYPTDIYTLSLGYGSIYNHSSQPNADFEWDTDNHLLYFVAMRDIKKDEEIFISYGKDYFSSRQIKIKKLPLKTRLKQFYPLLWLFIRFSLVTGLLYSVLAISGAI